ncbi:1-deoxyxylulose-5-phosphate synthase YajO-like [Aplysia californica]|uniref:1-deoxyxylulose-5-phosphate synthase YajO-like n=1 Tax=Aplysia californica TaxID=6500 RepID=A0ABM1VZM3_APLCA|nr:1-deoxyxylulose-5-phosphate synthase YajO-like [Aplysia californica]
MSAIPEEKKVLYPFLGRSGIRVSNLCLGTMTFGEHQMYDNLEFRSLQQQYNLACRESELEAFQVCKAEGMAVMPWSPLKGHFSRSVPQIALRWLLQKDVVTSVIIGARTLQQLDDNMAAANGWSLSKEEVGSEHLQGLG